METSEGATTKVTGRPDGTLVTMMLMMMEVVVHQTGFRGSGTTR
jgi:hypothetical protein